MERNRKTSVTATAVASIILVLLMFCFIAVEGRRCAEEKEKADKQEERINSRRIELVFYRKEHKQFNGESVKVKFNDEIHTVELGYTVLQRSMNFFIE